METLKAVYINEIFKISKKKKVTVALIFLFFSVIAAAFAIYSLSSFAGIRITGSSDFSIMVLTVLSYTLFPLFTAFYCIDMFAGEFADGTIKFTLTRPAPRFKVFLGKILAIASFIMTNLIFVMVLSLIVSIFINNGMPNILKILLAYIMDFFPQFVFALAVVLISNITKGTTSAFMLSILVFLVLNGLEFIFPYYKSLLFTSAFDWHTLILGSYINFSKMLRVLLILLGFGIMLYTASYYLFEKRDI